MKFAVGRTPAHPFHDIHKRFGLRLTPSASPPIEAREAKFTFTEGTKRADGRGLRTLNVGL